MSALQGMSLPIFFLLCILNYISCLILNLKLITKLCLIVVDLLLHIRSIRNTPILWEASKPITDYTIIAFKLHNFTL